MHFSGAAPSAVASDHGSRLGDPVGECALRPRRQWTLFHSTEDKRNSSSSMTNRVQVDKIQAREEIEKFRSIDVPFMENDDARSTRSDYSKDSSSIPTPSRMQTGETFAPGRISQEGYHAAVEWQYVDGRRESSICLSSEFDCLR